MLLHKLELASRHATDLQSSIHGITAFDSIVGYLSYPEGSQFKTIFYGAENHFRIYAQVIFDSTCSVKTSLLDISTRAATERETELIVLREDAHKRIKENEGNFFEQYDSVSFNLIPVITAAERKVFVLSAPFHPGDVLFGNDYVLTYSNENKFLSRKKLHSHLISLPMKAVPHDTLEVWTAHPHTEESSAFISSTDICILLLYSQFTNWKKHIVFSSGYVSLFDMEKKTLTLLTRKAFEKIYERQINLLKLEAD